jgi:hypothetical protein
MMRLPQAPGKPEQREANAGAEKLANERAIDAFAAFYRQEGSFVRGVPGSLTGASQFAVHRSPSRSAARLRRHYSGERLPPDVERVVAPLVSAPRYPTSNTFTLGSRLCSSSKGELFGFTGGESASRLKRGFKT